VKTLKQHCFQTILGESNGPHSSQIEQGIAGAIEPFTPRTQVQYHKPPSYVNTSILTLPGVNARGFLVQSVNLPVDVTTSE
jgi:hypothetical protein